MGKYTPPAVTLRDIAQALPMVKAPLIWRISLYPTPVNTTTLASCVELVLTRPDGATYVWRRWGAEAKSSSDAARLGALLRAAQEAYWYVEGMDEDTLLKRVQWDYDMVRKG